MDTSTPQDALPSVRFGVAGWSYPDWEGTVYPKRTGDKLEYLSRFVDLVEVNTTFYRPPALSMTESWVRRTEARPGFRFSAKLHQDVTHRRRVEDDLVRAFHDGLRPLIEAGRFSHLLAQFRYDFADRPDTRELLETIRKRFDGIGELVVEVRHNSWQSPGALDFFRNLGVTVANLDYPAARDGFSLRECRVGTNGYLRLHGRNRAAWFSKTAGRDETYDYLYSPEELAQIEERAALLLRSLRSLSIVGNNHFRGKELANILELRSRMTALKVPVPPPLLQEYPRLRAIAEE